MLLLNLSIKKLWGGVSNEILLFRFNFLTVSNLPFPTSAFTRLFACNETQFWDYFNPGIHSHSGTPPILNFETTRLRLIKFLHFLFFPPAYAKSIVVIKHE